jgi:hypothetical protein
MIIIICYLNPPVKLNPDDLLTILEWLGFLKESCQGLTSVTTGKENEA